MLIYNLSLPYTAKCVNNRKLSLGHTMSPGPDEVTRSGCIHDQILSAIKRSQQPRSGELSVNFLVH